MDGEVFIAELGQDLATGSAGRRQTVGHDRDCSESPVSGCYRRSKGNAFRAKGEAEGGVLHVATSEDYTVLAKNCRAYGKSGVLGMRLQAGLDGLMN